MNQFITVLSILFTAGYAVKLPSSIPLCKYDNNKCMLDSSNKAISAIYKGVSKLHLPPLDPLKINRIDIEHGEQNPVSMKISLIDCTVIGLKDLAITKISSATRTPKGFNLKFTAKVPRLQVIGQYDMKGNVLILPINGNGNCNLTLDDFTTDIRLIGTDDPLMKKGLEYLQIKKFQFQFETSRLHINFDNLYNGDEALGANTNQFLNDNWQDVIKEMKPVVEDTFGEVFKEILNRMFARVPYQDMFLAN